ncbi:MAG TPA: hypothetical protein PJ997_01615 [Candidatus Paceibacterota bacterium]|nr:hypothetical protein [Candidatus Paceibacterota bacterium]HMP19016.1 hypothetical protein [Candidatus Paceibacterota bacterium]
MINKFREFIKKYKNLNLILSGISLIYIWRGVWSLTDMFTFGEYDPAHFWSYLIPLVLSFTYIYINDYKLKELIHTD